MIVPVIVVPLITWLARWFAVPETDQYAAWPGRVMFTDTGGPLRAVVPAISSDSVTVTLPVLRPVGSMRSAWVPRRRFKTNQDLSLTWRVSGALHHLVRHTLRLVMPQYEDRPRNHATVHLWRPTPDQ